MAFQLLDQNLIKHLCYDERKLLFKERNYQIRMMLNDSVVETQKKLTEG